MIGSLISSLSGILYYPILIIVLIAAGLWFTFKTGFVQARLLGESVKVVMEKPSKEGSVSSFQALMVSTASRVGTGNIVGVSTAVCLGGYGAVFWMWLIAIVGGASAFIESTLAQVYKRRDENGDVILEAEWALENSEHFKNTISTDGNNYRFMQTAGNSGAAVYFGPNTNHSF